MSCQYCMQEHHQKDISAAWEVNYNALDIIAEHNPTTKITMIFFGGEPLMYANKMFAIVDYLRSKDANIDFAVISNGKALSKSLAQKLNDYKMPVTISHDGYAQHYRGYDPLKDNLEAFLMLENRSFSTVISAKNPDMRDMWNFCEEFEKNVSGRAEFVNFEFIQNTDGMTPEEFVLHSGNGIEFEKALDGVFEQIYQDILNENFKTHAISFMLEWLKGLDWRISQDEYIPKCGITYSLCDTDIRGNLYTCHSSQVVHGTIESNGVIASSKTLSYSETFCKGCPVLKFCGGGCILNTPETKHFDCYSKFNIWIRFAQLLERIGENKELSSRIIELGMSDTK